MSNFYPPIGYTCPMIDVFIQDMKYYGIEYSNQGHDISHIVELVINNYETLREANHKLRQWGESLASDVESLEEEIKELKQRK